MNDLHAFAKLVQALSPWRGQLVFIGGWAHRLHSLHPQANRLDYPPVFTHDTDLAFANKAPLAGDTIRLFGHLLPEFKDCWNTSINPALAGLGDTVAKQWEASFASVNDAIRQAVLIPANRTVSAEELQATCRYAFEQIFRP